MEKATSEKPSYYTEEFSHDYRKAASGTSVNPAKSRIQKKGMEQELPHVTAVKFQGQEVIIDAKFKRKATETRVRSAKTAEVWPEGARESTEARQLKAAMLTPFLSSTFLMAVGYDTNSFLFGLFTRREMINLGVQRSGE